MIAADAPPKACPTEGPVAECAVATMEYYAKRMCACRDKTCAETTNEALTKWGTEISKNPRLINEKPDAALTKKSADTMVRYVECMTKLMTPSEPVQDPCAGGGDDPCG